jgi:anaerobic selenocysteine-containing dehydrogenase
MGRNALNWERAMACLIALCGNLDVPGGNRLVGPPPDALTKVDIDDYAALPPAQRAKRLGAERFRLHHEGYERLNAAMQRVWYGRPYVLRTEVGAAAHAPLLWRAMLTAQPYPVRALFVQHNNLLGCYPNTRLAYDALQSPNLELLVVHEQFMTATAQLADYVLPAAGWLEKPFLTCRGTYDWMVATEQPVPPQAERRSDYQLWVDLAARLGIGGAWPSTLEELFDLMLHPVGVRFAELAQRPQPWLTAPKRYHHHEEWEPAQGGPRGFGTPTGQVELRSTILEALGYDPLPSFEEPLAPAFGRAEDYPFLLSTGATVIEFFHQDHRQMPSLRRTHPAPTVEIAPETAAALGIASGDWVWIETPAGRVRQRATLTPGLHPQVVVAERWWYPERRGEAPDLYGLWESNINAYTEDDPDLCDSAYGNWPFRLGRCRLRKV